MTGGKGAKGQKFFLYPSQLVSLSHTEEELKEAVKAERCVLLLTHTEASDEVRLFEEEPAVCLVAFQYPFPFRLVIAPHFPFGK